MSSSTVVHLPRVPVVVVTYNSAGVLLGCLESLRDGGADGVDLTDVVVVDNASADLSLEVAKSVEIEGGSHALMISHPDEVAALIEEASAE